MAKLTKVEAKAHAEAVVLLNKDVLSYDERVFVLDNWHEGANHINGSAGAFFTPTGLAGDFAIEAGRSTCAPGLARSHFTSFGGHITRAARANRSKKLSVSSAIPPISRSVAWWCRKPNGSAPTCSISISEASATSVARLQIRRSAPLRGAETDRATPVVRLNFT
ncbi:hypothetical protein [Bradyrhizobium elkanii]|uniref:hypothetical protein n=1 Tax=Bradyrhizobium elkanii TaxID=29448 RepID=UPI0018727F0C|nr:hypothetical protein [Bradyrhizobium elkanii]WLA85115.1 hypothetical protein QNJ99_13295 [Bradyrhizobium elkanii]